MFICISFYIYAMTMIMYWFISFLYIYIYIYIYICMYVCMDTCYRYRNAVAKRSHNLFVAVPALAVSLQEVVTDDENLQRLALSAWGLRRFTSLAKGNMQDGTFRNLKRL